MKVFLNMLKNKKYQFMFVLILIIVCLPFIHRLLSKSIGVENFQAETVATESSSSNSDEVKYGDIIHIKMQNNKDYKNYDILTAGIGRNGNTEVYNHNNNRNQMVYGYTPDNELSQLWIVKGPTGESENYKKGEKVSKIEGKNPHIRLESLYSNKNLHLDSKNAAYFAGYDLNKLTQNMDNTISESVISDEWNKKYKEKRMYEVSCFGIKGNDNDDSVWEIEFDGDIWKYNNKFELKHKNTGVYLANYSANTNSRRSLNLLSVPRNLNNLNILDRGMFYGDKYILKETRRTIKKDVIVDNLSGKINKYVIGSSNKSEEENLVECEKKMIADSKEAFFFPTDIQKQGGNSMRLEWPKTVYFVDSELLTSTSIFENNNNFRFYESTSVPLPSVLISSYDKNIEKERILEENQEVSSVFFIDKNKSMPFNKQVLITYSVPNFKSVIEVVDVTGKNEETTKKPSEGTLRSPSIRSLVVPSGYTLIFYKDPERKQPIIDSNNKPIIFRSSERYNNVNINAVVGVLLKSCPARVYSQCNYKGQEQCLDYGMHELDNTIASWKIDENVDAKIFSKFTDFNILGQNDFRNISCGREIEPHLATAKEIVLQPRNALKIDKGVFRNELDISSLRNIKVPLVNSEIPNYKPPNGDEIIYIKKNNIVLFLDASNIRSYDNVKKGKVWRDLSGNNNHTAFISQPRFKEGCFKSIDKNGIGIFGSSSINYKLEDGTKGYTLSFYVRPWASSKGHIFNLQNKKNKNGLNVHYGLDNKSIIFDNGWNSPSVPNNNGNTDATRLEIGLDDEEFFKFNVVTLRRTSNANGSKLSIWINGIKKIESKNNVAELDLDEENFSSLLYNFSGDCQSMILYNSDLSDEEIPLLSTWTKNNYDTYMIKRKEVGAEFIRRRIPDFPVPDGIKVLLDGKNMNSAQFGSKTWLDLSGNSNHFSFVETPNLKDGRYVKVHESGKFLKGPHSDSLGIRQEHGYTIFVLAKVYENSETPLLHVFGNGENNSGIKLTPLLDNETVFDQGGCCDVDTQRIKGSNPYANKYTVYTIRKSPNERVLNLQTVSKINKFANNVENTSQLSIFLNGSLVKKGSSGKAKEINLLPYPILLNGGGSLKLQDNELVSSLPPCKSDIGGLIVYNRALSDSEILLVNGWMKRPYYGTNVSPDGDVKTNKDGNIIASGLCVPFTKDGHNYSSSECLSWTNKDESGRYTTVSPNGSGWCNTDINNAQTRGFCIRNRDYELIYQKYDDTAQKQGNELSANIERNVAAQAAQNIVSQQTVEASASSLNAVQNETPSVTTANMNQTNSNNNTQPETAVSESFINFGNYSLYEQFQNNETEEIKKVSIENKYTVEDIDTHANAREKCLNKGGRLCKFEEIFPYSIDSAPSVGFDNLTEKECTLMGGYYDDNKCRDEAGIELKIPQYIKYNEDQMTKTGNKTKHTLYVPILSNTGTENQWAVISNGEDSSDRIGSVIDNPNWSLSEGNYNDNKKVNICCGIGTIGKCEGYESRKKLYTSKLNTYKNKLEYANSIGNKENIKLYTDLVTKFEKNLKTIQTKIDKECLRENYYISVQEYNKYREEFEKLVNRLNIEIANREAIEEKIMDLLRYENSDGSERRLPPEVLGEDQDSVKNMVRAGLIADLENEIARLQKLIENEIERIKKCPKDESLENCNKIATSGESHELQFAKQPGFFDAEKAKCSPDMIRKLILGNKNIKGDDYEKVFNVTKTRNILKNMNIKDHKDFKGLLELSKIQECPREGSEITIKQPEADDYNIKEHPDVKSGKYVKLTEVPLSRVPEDKKELWKKLKGMM